jgi:hypothetical protein
MASDNPPVIVATVDWGAYLNRRSAAAQLVCVFSLVGP